MTVPTGENLTFEGDFSDKEDRLRELIIYIAEKCRSLEFFGVVILNKVLFHSDFRSFRQFGRPITGAKYKKDERGPVPVHIKPLQMKMEERNDIRVLKEDVHGRTQRRVVPLRKPDLTLFSGQDIAIVDQVIQDLSGKTATQVSIESHGVQWNTRTLEDAIPYEAAYLSDEPITPADIERTAALAAKFGWGAA